MSKIVGKYQHERSENLDEYFKTLSKYIYIYIYLRAQIFTIIFFFSSQVIFSMYFEKKKAVDFFSPV